MSIDDGSWVALEANGRTSFVAVQKRLTHARPGLRHLLQLPVALSGLRLASYLDSLEFLLVEQAWHVAQGRNERTGEPCHVINPERVGTSNRDSSPQSWSGIESGRQVGTRFEGQTGHVLAHLMEELTTCCLACVRRRPRGAASRC